MAYTYGTSLIKKNNYDVFIRVHDSATWGVAPAALAAFGADGAGGSTVGKYLDDDTWDPPTDVCFGRIGKGNEKPTLKNSAGQSINLNTGDELVISENTEFSFEDLNVDAGNYTALRALAANGNVDILLVDTPASGAVTGYGASNVTLSVFLEVTGNDFNKIVLTAKRESDISENVLMPITVTAAA